MAVAGRTTPAFSLPTASTKSLQCTGQASWHGACLFWRRPFSSAVALNLQAYDYLHQGGANFFCKSQRINIDTLQATIKTMLSLECRKQAAEGSIWPEGNSMPNPDLHTWTLFPGDVKCPRAPLSHVSADSR